MVEQPKRFVIIPAGGTGTRMGMPYPKQLLPFRGATVIEACVDLFRGHVVLVAVPKKFHAAFKQKIGDRVRLVAGGSTRFESVRNAFEAIEGLQDEDLVLIHDAARPFLRRGGLEEAWRRAATTGAVIYASPAVDTLKRVDDRGMVEATLDRDKIFHAQTPQIYKAGQLRSAYAFFDAHPGAVPTDEAGLLEAAGIAVGIFESSPSNRKLTYREDLEMLGNQTMRVGQGYDVHRFDAERPLYLGGILIPESPGLAGHSDADAAIHALIDALLGAAGLGDIGFWFPDTDAAYKDTRSTVLLKTVWADLKGRGYHLFNADLTIQAQAPRLAPYMADMRARVAEILEAPIDRVNIKATTTEHLGFVGRKEGVAAMAIVLLAREDGR